MNKRLTATFFILTVVMAIGVSAVSASANVSVPVKKGDWIEYKVNETGSFPGEPNSKWARIEVESVQGDLIYINVTTLFTNGTYININKTVNFETGALEEGFFVPSNVTVGGVFYDSLVGNITVNGEEQRTYAGAERTVLSGFSPNSTFFWDKAKGILVEAHSYYPQYNYTIDTIVDKTNMWRPQILGLEPLVFYGVAAATIAVAALAIIVGIFVWRRRKSL